MEIYSIVRKDMIENQECTNGDYFWMMLNKCIIQWFESMLLSILYLNRYYSMILIQCYYLVFRTPVICHFKFQKWCLSFIKWTLDLDLKILATKNMFKHFASHFQIPITVSWCKFDKFINDRFVLQRCSLFQAHKKLFGLITEIEGIEFSTTKKLCMSCFVKYTFELVVSFLLLNWFVYWA